MSLIQDVAGLLEALPEGAVALVASLVKGAAAAPDPVDYLERRIVADAAHAASEEAVEQILAAEKAGGGT